MKREIMNKIIEKANKKTKDGIYSYQGYPYVVIKARLRFVGDFDKILEVCYGFAVIIGKCEPREVNTKIKELFNKTKNYEN